MFDPELWLRIICSMIASTVLFGIGAVAVLSTPALGDTALRLLPAVAVASVVLAPFAGNLIAPRMRIRHWGRERWKRGDAISG